MLSAWPFSDPFFDAPSLFHTEPSSFNLSGHETANGLEVELEVPRFRPEDISVTVDADAGAVTIEGKRPTHGRHAAHTGSHVPSFRRHFTVSTRDYDISKTTSEVANGLLTIRIPYAPEPASPKLEPAKATDVAIANLPPPAAKPAEGTSTAVATTTKAPLTRWPPKLHVTEKPADGVAVRYDYALPSGIQPENVHVKVLDNGTLRVDVSHHTKTGDERNFEERSASFTRFFSLPKGTRPDQVTANFDNGHLKVDVKHQ